MRTTTETEKRAQMIRLAQQERLCRREAEAFALVGAERAARHWAGRAARLQARLERLEERS